MDKNLIARFDSTYEEYLDSVGKVRKVCLDMLKEVCNRTESKEVSLDKLKNFLRDYGFGCPVVTYDGGNDIDDDGGNDIDDEGGNDIDDEPNCYSTVDGFRIESDAIRGEFIVLDIEDDYSYGIDRVLTVDIIRLCETIIQYEASGEYKLGVSDYGDDE